jgi:hypothetical protein
MSEHEIEPEVAPGGDPPADDRNEEAGESPVPDPEAKDTDADDDPEAD